MYRRAGIPTDLLERRNEFCWQTGEIIYDHRTSCRESGRECGELLGAMLLLVSITLCTESE